MKYFTSITFCLLSFAANATLLKQETIMYDYVSQLGVKEFSVRFMNGDKSGRVIVKQLVDQPTIQKICQFNKQGHSFNIKRITITKSNVVVTCPSSM